MVFCDRLVYMWEVSHLNVVQGTSTMLITLDYIGSEPNLIGWVGTCIGHPNDHPYGKVMS